MRGYSTVRARDGLNYGKPSGPANPQGNPAARDRGPLLSRVDAQTSSLRRLTARLVRQLGLDDPARWKAHVPVDFAWPDLVRRSPDVGEL